MEIILQFPLEMKHKKDQNKIEPVLEMPPTNQGEPNSSKTDGKYLFTLKG